MYMMQPILLHSLGDAVGAGAGTGGKRLAFPHSASITTVDMIF